MSPRQHVHALTRGTLISLALSLSGCKTTDLGLHIRTPHSADATAHVRMMLAEGSGCDAGLLFTGSTDRSGNLHIHTKACGDVRLVVSRRGSRSVQREIDTCDVHGLEVVLWPAPPPRVPDEACAQTAHQFLEAWIRRDDTAARALWAGPKDYASVARGAAHVEPWSVDVAPSNIEGQRCSVETRHFYEHGCDETWRVELEQLPEGWRVRGLELAEAAAPATGD
jgi:hypothetical protein